MHFKIGTRGSKLALWQAEWVKTELEKNGHTAELVIINTKGDQILNISLAKIGSKGVFTEELEEQLLNGFVHLAVHSAKDMPSTLPDALEIVAYSPRERVHDVLVSFNPDLKLESGLPFKVGTSSTRRVAILKHYFPHIEPVNIRGNLQTRFEKLKAGQCDALMLAYAGVERMNYSDFIAEHLPIEVFTPQAGQGAIAIEVAAHLEQGAKQVLKSVLNHPETERCVSSERSFLKTMGGGCSVPTFVYAHYTAKHQITIRGGIVDLDGREMAVQFLTVPDAEYEKGGEALAKKVLQIGGDAILQRIKAQLNA